MTETAPRIPCPRVLGLLAAVVVALGAPAAAQSPPPPAEGIERLPPVVVIDSTPVPALGTPIDKYAGNVQSVPDGDVERQHSASLAEVLYRGGCSTGS